MGSILIYNDLFAFIIHRGRNSCKFLISNNQFPSLFQQRILIMTNKELLTACQQSCYINMLFRKISTAAHYIESEIKKDST
jgi:hypothetical protein